MSHYFFPVSLCKKKTDMVRQAIQFTTIGYDMNLDDSEKEERRAGPAVFKDARSSAGATGSCFKRTGSEDTPPASKNVRNGIIAATATLLLLLVFLIAKK